MDDWPSFRRRRDVLRLALALIAPWVLLGLAWSLPLLERELDRAGHRVEWMRSVMFVWFYGFGFPGLILLAAFFLLGVFRLIRWREYRHSWYGWVSAVLVWLNLCVLSDVAH